MSPRAMTFPVHRPSHLSRDTYLTNDRRRLLDTRANLLVTAPDQALDAFVSEIYRVLREPVVTTAAQSFALHEANTLIVIAVDSLDEDAQRALNAWIDASENASAQIISLTTTPLFERVHRGQFDAQLYYRLNIVQFDLP